MWTEQHCCSDDAGYSPNASFHHQYPHYSQHHVQCFEPTHVPYEFCYQDTSNCAPAQPMDHCHNYPVNTCEEVPDVNTNHPLCYVAEATSPLPAVKNMQPLMNKNQIFTEISTECEHFLSRSECGTCNVRDENGGEQSIPIGDLVDIVLKTVDTMKPNSDEDVRVLSKKRTQNKVAAARYRDKQKNRWQELQKEQVEQEKKNRLLKEQVAELEEEVKKFRERILGQR